MKASAIWKANALRASALGVWLICVPVLSLRGDCSLTNLGLTPLPDLGWGSYSNSNRYFVGGLYPNGANSRPPAHEAAGIQIAQEQIQSLNTNGAPANNGQIVVLSSGMSNTTQEWATKGTNHFKAQADRDPSKNPRVVIVDGAIGGQDAPAWTNVHSPNWGTVLQRLASARLSTNQVQVLWLKQAIAGESGALTNHAGRLQSYLEMIVRNARTLFPNLRIAYVSSRTRCYSSGVPPESNLNRDPFAYETAFAVKWMIEKQINGAPELNYDPARGPVVAPWLSWGPYLWTDGLRGRSDGFVSICPTDLEGDFTHPSSNGVSKVGTELLAFFKTDATATPWFLRKSAAGQPPVCSPAADVTNGVVPLTVHFTANASDPDGPMRDFKWTFEDGTFSTNADPVKIFPAPGVYHTRLTVTDTNGNTASGVVIVSALATFDLWRQGKFTAAELANAGISGLTANPDADGLSNLLEYLLGSDPKVGDNNSAGYVNAVIQGGYFTFTYRRYKLASDYALRVEASPDLFNWSAAQIELGQVVDEGLTELVTVRLLTPLSSASQGFLRLNVVAQ